MTGAGGGTGATYGTSGGNAGAAIGGGAGGAGGGFWLHAAMSAKADAIISGLANLTKFSPKSGGNHIDQDSVALVQPKGEILSRCGIPEAARQPMATVLARVLVCQPQQSGNVTIEILQRAAALVGRELRLELV